MKGDLRMPTHFKLFEIYLWDEYGQLKEYVRDAIYMKPLFSYLYFEHDFFVCVWWNDDLGYWCGTLYDGDKDLVTYICETLEELKDEAEMEYAARF